MLLEEFLAAALPYTDSVKAVALWDEVDATGRKRGRYYHTRDHFEQLLHVLRPHRHKISDWEVVIFAIAYHDAVYNPMKRNNEEKSAALAETRLMSIKFPEHRILRCKEFILATKAHTPADEEINLFTDADLSILGASPEVYLQYAQQVRREYGMFPDFLYNPGRKKVLLHFLGMTSIFKTTEFRNEYEHQARLNLNAELQKLP